MDNPARFAICIHNAGYAASLEVGKLYRVLADDDAAKHQLVRIIDESGEDYLYAEGNIVPIELPEAAERVMTAS
jgi:hypothetical protein